MLRFELLKRSVFLLAASVFGALLMTSAVQAQETTGSVSGLPIPRFVSLKPSDTPMREGPSKDHRIKWVFKKEGVPVEIIAEFENWRRVRDSEGDDGWVFHSRLSGRRTAQINPKLKDPSVALYERDSDSAAVVARLQPGVIGSVEQCSGRWCRLVGEGFDGWLQQERLWGVYPGERVK
ncbi:MAG: SH3 domain-containing protein [Beijerinckiaceae bacterium]